MSISNQNKISNIESRDEAFEFLVQQSQNHVLKEKWAKELDAMDEPIFELSTGYRLLIYKRILGVAIAVILVLGAVCLFYHYNSSLESIAGKMLDDTYFAVVTDSYTRGVEDSKEKPLMVALQKEINRALERRDYNASVGLFKTKEKQTQLSQDDKFYYAVAISKVKNGDYYKAIDLLEDVAAQHDKFSNESLWLQGLLYIKIGNLNNSKILLNNLSNDSKYQRENVQVLLEKFDG